VPKLMKPKEPFVPDIQMSQEGFEVANFVANEYGIAVEELYAAKRLKPLPEARFMCWTILYQRGFTYSHIARLFDHTHGSIMNGVKQFRQFLEVDALVRKRWERVKWMVHATHLCNSWDVTLNGSVVVRSNHDLHEAAVSERALAQVESGLVLLSVSRINKQQPHQKSEEEQCAKN
jgi:hypothetical protein